MTEHTKITFAGIALCFSLLACRQICICPPSKETVKVVADSSEIKKLRTDLYWITKDRNTWHRRYNSLEALLPDTVIHLRFDKQGKRI